jgi:putative tricarboxylic transport membrane protein
VSSLGQLLTDLHIGLSVAFSLEGLFYCFVGVVLGTFIGVLPGIGPLASIALLMPLTFHFDPTIAIIMLAGIYYGSAYGGATASILLNLPGTANTAVTCLDGYPMARQGRAGVALFIHSIASFSGGVIGILIMALFSPPLAHVALRFGSQEYFGLMVLGLLAASLMSSGSPFRSLTMVTFGLLLGIVGVDVNSGQPRFTFGMINLYDGLPLVAIALGLFGMPEIIANSGRESASARPGEITLRSMFPTREDWRRSWKPILRGAGIGSFFGTLPGTGGLIASFMSYAVEMRVSKDSSRFGKGAIEGIAGPEASNNAAVQTAFIPTLTLGIPGDAIMALMLGVLMIFGVVPGPQLITQNPQMFWGLVFSFLIGNVLLVLLNIPLISIWVRILTIPYSILYPAVVVFVCIGVYSVRYSVGDIYIVMVFGAIGYGMALLRFQPAPLILGLILGPMMEENLRRSLLLSNGDPLTFVQRPLSATFIAISVLMLVVTVISEIRKFAAKRHARG